MLFLKKLQLDTILALLVGVMPIACSASNLISRDTFGLIWISRPITPDKCDLTFELCPTKSFSQKLTNKTTIF